METRLAYLYLNGQLTPIDSEFALGKQTQLNLVVIFECKHFVAPELTIFFSVFVFI